MDRIRSCFIASALWPGSSEAWGACDVLLCSTTAVQNIKHISESADIGHLDANENLFLGLQCIVK